MGYYFFRPVDMKQSYKDRTNQKYKTKLETLDEQQALFAKGQRKQNRNNRQDNTTKGNANNDN